MPKFNPNPSQVEAGFFTTLPKNDEGYELKITGVKAFHNKSSNPDGTAKENHGVMIAFVVAEGEFANKRISSFKAYQHTDGSQQYVKSTFLIPAFGFDKTPEAEKDFNMWAETQDFGYDTETGGTGDAWAALKGKRVRAFVSVTRDDKDVTKEYQQFDSFAKV